MKWIFVVFLFGSCLVLCQGSKHHKDKDDSCECDGDSGHHHKKSDDDCECSNNDGSKWICSIVIVSAIAVGVTGVSVGCCIYSKKCKSKRTKTHPDQTVSYIAVSKPEVNKKPLPDDHWAGVPPPTPQNGSRWTTVHPSAPPSYSDLPAYQPELRDVMSPPPPYIEKQLNYY